MKICYSKVFLWSIMCHDNVFNIDSMVITKAIMSLLFMLLLTDSLKTKREFFPFQRRLRKYSLLLTLKLAVFNMVKYKWLIMTISSSLIETLLVSVTNIDNVKPNQHAFLSGIYHHAIPQTQIFL